MTISKREADYNHWLPLGVCLVAFLFGLPCCFINMTIWDTSIGTWLFLPKPAGSCFMVPNSRLSRGLITLETILILLPF